MSATGRQPSDAQRRALIESERFLLAHFIAGDRELVRRASVSDNDFTGPGHREIYRAAVDLIADEAAVDARTLRAELERRGELERIGGGEALSHILEEAYTAANFDLHVRRVRGARFLRDTDRELARLRSAAQEARRPEDVLASLHAGLEGLEQRARAFQPSPVDALWKTLGQRGWLEQGEPPKRAYLVRRPLQGDEKPETGFDDEGHPNPVRSRGLIPAGRVGIVAGGGGMGKSWALMQLAIAVASGSKWLGHFEISTEPGPVLLALAEEELEEMRRRIYWAVSAAELDDDQRKLLARNLYPLPLAGISAALTETNEARQEVPSTFQAMLRERLERAADPWRLVVLDPISRFAGPDVETDNAAGTRFVRILESLADLSGATIVAAHHTKKASRGGASDETALRGSSSLVDGARWVLQMDPVIVKAEARATKEKPGRPAVYADGFAELRLTKRNYSPPMKPVTLRRNPDNGVLRAATDADAALLSQLRRDTGEAGKDESTGDEIRGYEWLK